MAAFTFTKMQNMTRKILIAACLVIGFKNGFSQNAGIGTMSPNPAAMLEISASDKGVLIPRVALTSLNSFLPLSGSSSNANALLVYNTTTGGSLTPGFYYWNAAGVKWMRLQDAASSLTGWSTTGNAGTDPDVNFIGTTDYSSFQIRVNSEKAGVFMPSGEVFLGVGAGGSDPYGHENIGIGRSALMSNSSGYKNVAVGLYALNKNIYGFENVALGFASLLKNEYGEYNTAVGAYALNQNTANANTAVGHGAMGDNTTGWHNVGVGARSLGNNLTGNENTSVGYFSLFLSSSGNFNTAVGTNSLYQSKGDNNTAIGVSSFRKTSIGNNNTGLGYMVANDNSTGNSNTVIGANAFQYNTTGSYNTLVGAVAGYLAPATGLNNYSAFGYAAGTGGASSNMVELGSNSVSIIRGQVGFSTYSDGRIKDNITANVPGLQFIQQLRPVTYNLNIHKQWELMNGRDKPDTLSFPGKYDIEKITMSGFIAQDVEKAAKALGYDCSAVIKPQNEHDLYGMRYDNFIPSIVKAIQEQQQMIQQQKQEIAELKQALKTVQETAPPK